MAMIHEITAQVGRNKQRKRIGRGHAAGQGKTAGRGHKGAKSRAGWGGSIHPLYQGGQMPYFRRIPKRGFTNAMFRTEYAIVNVKALNDRFDDGAEVNPEMLAKAGLLGDLRKPVKILGDGELTKKLTVTVHRCSRTAQQKIESAGGSVTLLEPAKSA
jgi:large subunit ribosomal protein L15